LVLICPAMAVPSAYYRPLIAAFESKGWQATALPRRGFERDQPTADRSHDWSYADETAVVTEAVRAARAEAPARPVITFGHSLGAHLAAANQINGAPADAMVGIGAGLPWFRRYGLAWPGVATIGAAVWPLTAAFGYVPPPAFGAPGPRTLMREWSNLVLLDKLPFDVPHKIVEPSLVIHLAGDVYASSGSVKHFSRRLIEPEALTPWHYTRDLVPEGGTTHHVSWAKAPSTVVDKVVDWWDLAPTPAN
jgi:predicted alpha/beta hydrolase